MERNFTRGRADSAASQLLGRRSRFVAELRESDFGLGRRPADQHASEIVEANGLAEIIVHAGGDAAFAFPA
jgi:hypothetical protein